MPRMIYNSLRDKQMRESTRACRVKPFREDKAFLRLKVSKEFDSDKVRRALQLAMHNRRAVKPSMPKMPWEGQ